MSRLDNLNNSGNYADDNNVADDVAKSVTPRPRSFDSRDKEKSRAERTFLQIVSIFNVPAVSLFIEEKTTCNDWFLRLPSFLSLSILRRTLKSFSSVIDLPLDRSFPLFTSLFNSIYRASSLPDWVIWRVRQISCRLHNPLRWRPPESSGLATRWWSSRRTTVCSRWTSSWRSRPRRSCTVPTRFTRTRSRSWRRRRQRRHSRLRQKLLKFNIISRREFIRRMASWIWGEEKRIWEEGWEENSMVLKSWYSQQRTTEISSVNNSNIARIH